MDLRKTRIDVELDLQKDGKQSGFLRIPHSVHRSAYGWLPMPVACIRNGDGPKVLLMAGNHGDEYEGQVALTKLIRNIDAKQVNGRIIVLPMANYPAALAGTRTSPVDQGNLNRTFPGNPDGGITQLIAHFIEEVLLPGSDLFVDLHSGGSSLNYIPSAQVVLNVDGSLDPHKRSLVDAFAAPHSHVFLPDREDRMSNSAAQRKGVPAFTTELGGIGTVSRCALQVAEHGIARVLRLLGVLADGGSTEAPPTRYLKINADTDYVYARDVGLFEPLVELGDEVRSGQAAAAVHFPETPWRAPQMCCFEGEGVVVCQRIPGRVERGDCLFHLASDWSV